MIKPHHRNHALIGAGFTLASALVTNPIAGATFISSFYLGREIYQFFSKKHLFNSYYLSRHVIDVLSTVVGAALALGILRIF